MTPAGLDYISAPKKGGKDGGERRGQHAPIGIGQAVSLGKARPGEGGGIPLRRVRGISSHLDDLTLRGEKWRTVVGDGLLGGTLARKTVGASVLTLTISDPNRELLRSPLIEERHQVALDGLNFRFVAVESSGIGLPLVLTYEPEVVTKLKQIKGPHKAFRDKVTRAEFAKRLADMIKPDPVFISPELHKVQPIASAKASKEAGRNEEDELVPHGGHLTGVKCKGQTPTPSQLKFGEMALRIANEINAPFRVQVALIEALIDETDMGLVQANNILAANPSGGGPPEQPAEDEMRGFLTGKPNWTQAGGAIAYFKSHPNDPPHVIAQAIQASGTPDGSNYAQFYNESKVWVEKGSGLTGSESGGGESVSVPVRYAFRQSEEESNWACMTRLASEVHWRCFESAGWIYFISEEDLLESAVRMDISDSAPGVIDTNFKYDLGRDVTEIQVNAHAKAWEAPPGTVVNVTRHGPADGTYIVDQIEAPLERRDGAVTITLKKPTKPLKEPAAETKTTTKTRVGGGPKGSEGYVNPVPHGWVHSRTDMGVDFAYTAVGAKILAIGNAKILPVPGGEAHWEGGNAVLYQLLDGSHAGAYIYNYEGLFPKVSPGQTVGPGDVIATGGITGSIELGFANSRGEPLSASEHSEIHPVTKYGALFRKFMDELGAP